MCHVSYSLSYVCLPLPLSVFKVFGSCLGFALVFCWLFIILVCFVALLNKNKSARASVAVVKL